MQHFGLQVRNLPRQLEFAVNQLIIGSKNKEFINSRAYEALRIEFSKTIGKVISEHQKGENNSQFGTKWYTNRNTGESKKFKEQPVEEF